MKKDVLHEPFELVRRDYMEVCPRGEHTHNFFEIIYVIDGTGIQCINSGKVNYKQGDVFLLAPEDVHYFDIKTPTSLFFIRFNSIYVKSKELTALQRIEQILQNAGKEPGCVIKDNTDKVVVKSIMEALIEENCKRGIYHKELISQYVNTLLIIIARNIMAVLPQEIEEQSNGKAISILQYIQTNIYNPELLRGENISQKFGISEAYIGRFFKSHMNETLQQYTLNYKLKLIENRLLHTDMQINQIADEFGFTDKSHLNRIFKKYKGMNPTQYRQQTVL